MFYCRLVKTPNCVLVCLRALRVPVYQPRAPGELPSFIRGFRRDPKKLPWRFKDRCLLACHGSVRRHSGMETDVALPIACIKLQP